MSIGKLPQGWVEAKISDVSTKCEQRIPALDENFIYIDIGSIDRESKKIVSPQYLLGCDAPSRARKVVNIGDVIVSLTRPNLNAVAQVDASLDGQIASTGFEVIKPLGVISSYLFALVRSQHFIHSISDQVQGALYPAAKSSDVQGYSFALPPLAEQQQIAAKLDELLAQVDSLKTRLDAIPKILKRFRQSVLAAAVSGKLTEDWRGDSELKTIAGIQVPETWSVSEAQHICLKVQSGSTPRDNPFDQDGSIPFLKVYNIVNQNINFDYKQQFIKKETHESALKRSIALPNDILMNIVGPPLGKVAILTDQYPEWNINQAITLFRTDPKTLSYKYLYYVLCEGALVRAVMPETKGSVGQVNISLSQCREALITVPPIEEQAEIVSRVEQLFAYADQIEQRVKDAQSRVNHLTQSILAKAFRGELTAEWREQNPDLISGVNSAEALLARIQAEREGSGKTVGSRRKKATT